MKLKKDLQALNRQSQDQSEQPQSEKEVLRSKERKPTSGKESKIDVNKVVLEFLHKNNYTEAFRTFKREVESKNEENKGKAVLKSLLASFDAGNGKDFFQVWDKTCREVEVDTLLRDDIGKLEFYFQIYFCIYWIHPKGKNLKVRSYFTQANTRRQNC